MPATIRLTAGITLSSEVPLRCSKAARTFAQLVAPRPLVRISLIVVSSGLQHNLIQRVLDDAGCIGCLQARNNFACGALLHNGIDRDPVGIAEMGDCR